MNSGNTRSYEPGYFAQRPIFLVAGLSLLASIPIGMIMLFLFGTVRGSEFSPDDFTRRHFSYQQIPWVNWTVFGIEYDDITPELEQTLISDGLISRRAPAKGKKKTWHLYDDVAVPDSHACDARFLTSYLDFSDWDSKNATATPFWLKWNEKFPLSAKILWPTVADLARNEMYLVIPDVMRLALNVAKDQPESFQSDLNKLTQKGWILAGESDLQTGKYQRAAKRFCRAELIDSSGQSDSQSSKPLAALIQQCRTKTDQFDDIQSHAVEVADELKAEIDDALSDDADSDKANDSSSKKTKAEAEEPSEP